MSLTLIIIGITVLVSWRVFESIETRNKLIFNPYVINSRKEYHRFLTSGLIHADYTHLFVNMIVLYSFGEVLEFHFEKYFGGKASIYFGVLYVFGIILAHIPSYFQNLENPAYNSLGASGAVSAVTFACILINPLDPIYLFFAVPIPGILFGVFYMVYSFYAAKKMQDNINHSAHITGAIFGIVLTILYRHEFASEFFEKIFPFI